MSDPVTNAVRRVWVSRRIVINRPRMYMESAVRDALKPIRELHKPVWWNCINACCSGEECRNRSRTCAACDEDWPCATAKLIYSSDELAREALEKGNKA